VPSVKVHELTKFHSEFDNSGGALYTTTFVMGMNKAKYNSLAPDLKKVIDNNSGLATSGWLGKVQQGNDPAGRKAAEDRKSTIYKITPADAQEFKRKARLVEVEWVQDMDKRGFDGKKLLETARTLIDKHGKAEAPAKKA
jgi:TRAP-type transport system periplasmic protein